MRVLRWAGAILAVLLLCWLYLATLHPLEPVATHSYFDKPGPWVIAHRGGRGLWPENTLAAFDGAHALGVDVLEMDLRVTADGAFAVMHDGSVDRTTSGSGRVREMTLAAVRSLDAGYRFRAPDGDFPYRGKGIAVPTFEEVLDRYPDARLNVEMKSFSRDDAARLCTLLRERRAAARVLIASFDHDSLAALRRNCPEVPTSASFREALALYQFHRFRVASLYRSPALALQVPERFGSSVVIETRFLDLAASLNVRVQVWTVNSESDMKRLLAQGVHGILTDYPDRLLRLLGR